MNTTENGNQITLSEAAKSLGIEIDEAIGILKKYANLSNLNEDSEISTWQFSILEVIVHNRAKEKEKLKAELKGLSTKAPSAPPPNNAMCYCPSPETEGLSPETEGLSTALKVLIIVAVALVIAIGVVILLIR